MSLTKKELFSLLSFNQVGLSKKHGEFNTEKEAQEHATQLDYVQNKVYGWNTHFLIVHNQKN